MYCAYVSAARRQLGGHGLGRGPGWGGGRPFPKIGVRCFARSRCSQWPTKGCGGLKDKRALLGRPALTPASGSRG